MYTTFGRDLRGPYYCRIPQDSSSRQFFLNTLGLKTVNELTFLLKKLKNSENSDLNEVLSDRRASNGRKNLKNLRVNLKILLILMIQNHHIISYLMHVKENIAEESPLFPM